MLNSGLATVGLLMSRALAGTMMTSPGFGIRARSKRGNTGITHDPDLRRDDAARYRDTKVVNGRRGCTSTLRKARTALRIEAGLRPLSYGSD